MGVAAGYPTVLSLRFERLCRPLAVLFPVFALVGVGVPLALGRETFAILGVYVAVPLVLGTVVSLTVRYPDGSLDSGHRPTVPFKPLVVGYVVCQAGSLVLLALSPVRPTAYFLVVAAGVVFLFLQMLRARLTSTRVGLVLAQCGALVLNLLWGVTFKYEFFFGRSDVFPHAAYATQVVDTGHVTTAFENYEWFPLWHVLAAIERLYLGIPVPPRYFFFLTNGLAYAVLVGGIYLLARRLVDSQRVALAASLFTALNTWVILYGMYSIPRSAVAVLSVFLLVVLVDRGPRATLVFLVLLGGILVYHPVSIPFVLVMLGAVYLVQNVFGDGWVNDPVHYRHFLLIGGVQLAYWGLVARDLYRKVLTRLTAAGISGAAGVGGTGASIPNPAAELVNYLQFSFLLLLVAVAVLVGLRSDRLPWVGKVTVLSGALVSVVSFPGPTLLLSKFASNFNILRFGQYTFPLIGIAGAVGAVTLFDGDVRVGGPRSRAVFRGLVVVFVFSTAFLAVSNDFVASDNPTVEREFYNFYLSESELDGYGTVSALAHGRVITDVIGCKYLANTRYKDCTVLQTNPDRTELLTGDDDNVVVLRTTDLRERGLQAFPTTAYDQSPTFRYGEVYLETSSPAWDDLERWHKVYATDDVAAFTGPDGARPTNATTGG